MTVSIDWGNTNVITVQQSDMTDLGNNLYELDVDQFRQTLRSLEQSEEGISFPKTHSHNTEASVAGVTYARLVQILSPYSVEFEDGQYSVRLTGANNNIFDVQNGILVQNQVQVIPTNSAGLTSSGFTDADAQRLLDVFKRLDLDSGTPNTYANNNSEISNSDFSLTKTDNGNGTFTVNRS